jgi:tetratricopeptide (TPR) repeat protein
MNLALIIALVFQPDVPMLRRLFEQAFARQPTAQAARDLGLFLARNGDPNAARTALAEAVRIDTDAIGPSAAQTLQDVAELAAISPPAEATALWTRVAESPEPALAARAFAALGDLRTALAKQEAATGRDSEAVAVRLIALALTLEPKDGIPLLERAVTINRAKLGRRHPQTATTEANLAGLLVHVGRFDDAILAAGDALSIFQETLGPDHPRNAVTVSILAFAFESKGDRVRAERMYRLAVVIDEKSYGATHPQTKSAKQALEEFLRAPRR